MTIEELKRGSRVMLGKYGVRNDDVYPIWWTKATHDCQFIAESVLDYLVFDAKEPSSAGYGCRNYGNPNYEHSNILRFLNSEEENWFRATHTSDCAPTNRSDTLARYGDPAGVYANHHGFLYHFNEYEIAALGSAIELPKMSDVNKHNDECFELFKKKGVRAHPTYDFAWHAPNVPFYEDQFADFWLQDSFGDKVRILDRTGNVSYKAPALPSGLRPKCKIKADAEVEIAAGGEGFIIKPFEIAVSNPATDEELLAFLGLR